MTQKRQKHPHQLATKQVTSETPMVVMGHIVGPHGILGWVKVCPYTEYTDGLLGYPTWWLGSEDDEWNEVEVASVRIQNESTLQAKFESYTDRTLAMQITGMQIAIPRSQLPSLPENGTEGYYWSDLVGAQVINLQGEKLGKVTGLLETGANDVLQIQCASEHKKELLIPFIDQAIIKVDLEFCRITVDWGMDY